MRMEWWCKHDSYHMICIILDTFEFHRIVISFLSLFFGQQGSTHAPSHSLDDMTTIPILVTWYNRPIMIAIIAHLDMSF
jgi:hypothetical protein